jgi:hypothetical protein
MKIIGIAGYAKAGKDTFVGIAKTVLQRNNYTPMRVAFADRLKEEVQRMLEQNNFQINVTRLIPEEKERVRPVFVFWGCQRRHESEKGMYWVNIVDNYLDTIIRDHLENGQSTERVVALVSDVRFPNEAKWVHEKWEGELIHLRRYRKIVNAMSAESDGTITRHYINDYDNAPNEEELKQDPLVLKQSDIRAEWENKGFPSSTAAEADPELQKIVLDTLNKSKFFNGSLL